MNRRRLTIAVLLVALGALITGVGAGAWAAAGYSAIASLCVIAGAALLIVALSGIDVE